MKPRIANYQDLKQILIRENGESFVVVNYFDNTIKYGYIKQDMAEFFQGKIIVRETVAHKLSLANQELKKVNPNFTLYVVYGYRTLEIQEKYFRRSYKNLKKDSDYKSEEELIQAAHIQAAAPEVAGHPTGAAIDITIFDNTENEFIDMGGKIADFNDDRFSMFAENLTPGQKENRKLLESILVNQEFYPFYGEWWHYAYGDREWAWFYGKPYAIYKQMPLASVSLKS